MKKEVLTYKIFLVLSIVGSFCYAPHTSKNEDTSATAAKIVESHTITAILPLIEKYKGKKVLVAFDLDNTLVRACSYVSSVEFMMERGKRMVKEGAEMQDVMHYLYNEYIYLTHYEPLCLVESNTPVVLEQLRKAGVDFIGLTAKPMHVWHRTLDQLAALNVTFNFPDMKSSFLYLNKGVNPAFYDKGVMFCDWQNKKHDALTKFFEKCSYHPDVVIFLDDDWKYLQGMEKKMEQEGIIFEGVRVSACDKFIQDLNYEEAQKQLVEFKAWLIKNPPAVPVTA